MKVIKNKSVSKLRRIKTANARKVDIEDPYFIGNKKSWSWHCPMLGCNGELLPYKQDKYGDIIVACSNPYCIKSGNFESSINVQLKKLLKKQQMNSSLFYRRYDGGYY